MLWYVGNGLFITNIQKEVILNLKKKNMNINLRKMSLTASNSIALPFIT